VTQTLKGRDLSERVIAQECFDIRNLNPDIDSAVRNAKRHAKQKLIEYYHSDGIDDSVRIELVKGIYNASFSTHFRKNEELRGDSGGRVYLQHQQYQRLYELIANADAPDILYVAIGTADIIAPWLRRSIEPDGGSKPLEIRRLIILCYSPRRSRELEKAKILPTDFTAQMLANLRGLRTALPFPMEVRCWTQDPSFHGWLYGDVALRGEWNKRGLYHVRTPVTEFSSGTPEYREMLKTFKSAKTTNILKSK
jgi:hypothetical protein